MNILKSFALVLFLLISFRLSYSQEILPANQNTLDSIKQTNKGKVILFNFWATWCEPCIEEFPSLVKLYNNYKNNNFKIIFVTLDLKDVIHKETIPFMKKQGVDFISYYNNFDKDEDLINYMDKNWDGGIPATFIFDKKGNLQTSFIGKRKYKDFKEAVEKLIN